MAILTPLQTAAGNLNTTVNFGHGERAWHNLVADREDEHVVICYVDEPLSSLDTLTRYGSLVPKYPLTILFGKATPLHDDPANAHSQVVDGMRALAEEYIHRLRQLTDADGRPVFSAIGNIRRTDFYNLLDSNLAGCMLELEVTVLDPGPNCLPHA